MNLVMWDGQPDIFALRFPTNYCRETPALEKTENVITFAADVRLPPQFSDDEFAMLVKCIVTSFRELQSENMGYVRN